MLQQLRTMNTSPRSAARWRESWRFSPSSADFLSHETQSVRMPEKNGDFCLPQVERESLESDGAEAASVYRLSFALT